MSFSGVSRNHNNNNNTNNFINVSRDFSVRANWRHKVMKVIRITKVIKNTKYKCVSSNIII